MSGRYGTRVGSSSFSLLQDQQNQLNQLDQLNQEGGGQRWEEFKHNGVIFSPEYQPHNIPIILKSSGKKIFLSPIAEEYANFYAVTSQTGSTMNRTFVKNFWNSWQKVLSKENLAQIKEIRNVDFSEIYNYLEAKRQQQSGLTKEEKRVKSEIMEVNDAPFKSMIVNGNEQPVGNFRVEPSGIFLGRGCNPKTGKVKKRTLPADISINISQNGTIPAPPNKQAWNVVIHKPDVWWLASWKEPVSNKIKSVRLANSSEFKAASDQNKFDLARKLKRKVKSIREANKALLTTSKVKKELQLATALYLIDELALRVGNEKGKEETDTVGVSSLRVEHITFLPNNKIQLDFLGKDSIRFLKDFQVTPEVYRNLKLFTKEKKKSDPIFDRVKSKDINDYLRSLMKGLTSKVFRTMNASTLYQSELGKASRRFASLSGKDTAAQAERADLILDAMKEANRQVAILCNHQKAVSKNFSARMDKINAQIQSQELKIKLLRKRLREAKKSKTQKEKKQKKVEATTSRLAKEKLKLEMLKRKKQSTVNLKSISLDTSRTNYIDPRISFAFARKHRFDPAQFFSTALQQRFEWAQDTKADWKF